MRCLFAVLLFLVAGCSKPPGSLGGFRQLCSAPTNRPVTIVFHGHSVPAGSATNKVFRTFDSYPHLVHRALADRYSNAMINVVVTAQRNENSERGAMRFRRDVLRLKPDLVVLDYGLNDRSIGLTRALAAWTKMINQAGNVPLVLVTPSPDIRQDCKAPTNPHYQHAEQIRALAKSSGCPVADVSTLFNALPLEDITNMMRIHPVHPNRKGHEIIAAEIVKVIVRD